MNEDRMDKRRIDRLVERLKDDALSSGELAELRDIIRNRPQARRRVVELLYLSAELRESMGTWSDAAPAGRGRGLGWVAAVALATAAVLALVFWRPWLGAPAPGSAEGVVVVHPDEGGIAVVTRTSGLQWGKGTTLPVGRLELGEPVGAGVLEIESGLVQIDFYSGATVILEGPARLGLVSPELGSLEYGNLWAHVPPPARGFRIESGAFDVLDLGTEFGMRVGRDGRGEVHVLDGEVEVHSKRAGGGLEQLLRTGQGVELGSDGSRHEIEARPEGFAAAGRLGGELRQRFERWLGDQGRWAADPDVRVSYDFQDLGPWKRVLRNAAAAAPPGSDGAIVGCRPAEGRWPGKGALAFRNSSHRVRLDLPGSFDNLTLSCWLRVDRLESPRVALLHPETDQESYIHWTLVNVRPGVMHVHFSETAREAGKGKPDRKHYHCGWNLLRDASLGSWMNLALVYDSEAGKVSHFLNGQLIGVNEIEAARPVAIGRADIGNWPYREWAEGTQFELRNLDGLIDEFMVINRALTADEMSSLFESGKP